MPQEREDVLNGFIDAADITDHCNLRPNGMYVAKKPRFDKLLFIDEVAEHSGLGRLAVTQAMMELKILQLLDYSDAHTSIVNPQAVLFVGGYREEHAREAFRFSHVANHQYYWIGDRGVIREEQDRQRAYDELAREDRLNKSPTIPRSTGQFIPGSV